MSQALASLGRQYARNSQSRLGVGCSAARPGGPRQAVAVVLLLHKLLEEVVCSEEACLVEANLNNNHSSLQHNSKELKD